MQPLHACVREEDEATSSLLLMLGPDVEARDPKGSTALIIAAVRGHEQTVKALLAHGASTDAADKDGLTALHWSTAMGHVAVVQALVKAVSFSSPTTLQPPHADLVHPCVQAIPAMPCAPSHAPWGLRFVFGPSAVGTDGVCCGGERAQGAKLGATRPNGVTVEDLALGASAEIRAALKLC